VQLVATILRSEATLRPDVAALASLSILLDSNLLKKAFAISEMPTSKQKAAVASFVQPIASAIANQEEKFQKLIADNEELLYTIQDNDLEEGAIFALLEGNAIDQFSSMATMTGTPLISAASSFFGNLAKSEQSVFSAAQIKGIVPTMMADLSPTQMPAMPSLTPQPVMNAQMIPSSVVTDASPTLNAKKRRSMSSSEAIETDGAIKLAAEATSKAAVILSTLVHQLQGSLPTPTLDDMTLTEVGLPKRCSTSSASAAEMKQNVRKRGETSSNMPLMASGSPSMVQRDALDGIVLPSSMSSITTDFPIISQPPHPMEPGMMALSFDAAATPTNAIRLLTARQAAAAVTPTIAVTTSAGHSTALQRGLMEAFGFGVLACLLLGSVFCVVL